MGQMLQDGRKVLCISHLSYMQANHRLWLTFQQHFWAIANYTKKVNVCRSWVYSLPRIQKGKLLGLNVWPGWWVLMTCIALVSPPAAFSPQILYSILKRAFCNMGTRIWWNCKFKIPGYVSKIRMICNNELGLWTHKYIFPGLSYLFSY